MTTQTKDVAIRFQVLDSVWETVGSDRARGTWPEDVTLTADHWGPSKASFSLHRDPLATWPDIGAFTPVVIEVGGVLVWSGRVSETPISQSNRVINVQCEGWQYHLDDDVYQRAYVHTKLSEYRDMRGVPGAVLGAAALNAGAQVTADGGQLYLGWGSGTAISPGTTIGAVVDLGASSRAKRVVVTWESSNNAADFICICRAADVATNVDAAGNYSDAFSFALNAGATGTTAGTFATARRYVKFYVYDNTFTGTLGTDYYWKITACSVFAETAYESGNASILKATTIIPDALTRATLLLSPDRSQIDPGATVTFTWPEFALDGMKTPREVLTAANAAHDYVLKVDAGRRVVFKPKPSTPLIEIGEWPGSSFEDASANSGEEIYNRVVVEGTAANGEKLSVERMASQGAVGEPITSPVADNPSFATVTTSWTPSTGTSITRDTVTFNTSPASGRWDRGVGVTLQQGDQLTESFTGTFRAGVAYTLTFWLRADGTSTSTTAKVIFGNSALTDGASQYVTLNAATSQAVTVTITWMPTADQTTGQLLLFKAAGSGVAGSTSWYRIDSLGLTTSRPTLIDKRGFKRSHVLPVKASLTVELATQIATVWLDAHKTTPLKGTVRIDGDQAVREIITGASVAPELLLLRTGELLRLADRVDPDTGGQGRNGRIAEVTFSMLDNSATVALDSRRTSHEALLERLAVVVGSG